MVTEAGKELLRNTINTAKFHNRILEENEMWKQWELECGLTMMVSDDDIIKRIKKSGHQCSKHRRRDKSRSRDSSRSKYEMAKVRQRAGSSNDRWDHSGFAELYPDADIPDKYPSTSSFSDLDKHKKKKKKSHRRSNSSDKEIWEEFKRTDEVWTKENILNLIDLLSNAPALWNINYPGYKNEHLKQKEIMRMAREFRVHENEIETQISFLIDEFHKEHEKMNGACANYSENKWFAYKHLTFLINNKNESNNKTSKEPICKEIPHWVDSSDSYSESEDDTSAQISTHKSRWQTSKVEDEKRDKQSKRTVEISTEPLNADLPYLKAYLAQQDSFSVYGEIVAHRLRKAKKSHKAVARVQKEMDYVLHKFETGFFDP